MTPAERVRMKHAHTTRLAKASFFIARERYK